LVTKELVFCSFCHQKEHIKTLGKEKQNLPVSRELLKKQKFFPPLPTLITGENKVIQLLFLPEN